MYEPPSISLEAITQESPLTTSSEESGQGGPGKEITSGDAAGDANKDTVEDAGEATKDTEMEKTPRRVER